MNKASFSLAISAILRQKKRAALTMLAISIGIAAAIMIMAAGKGIQKLVVGQLDAFGPDTLYIETKIPNKKADSGSGAVGVTITTLRDRDIEDVVKHPNILAANGQVSGQEAVSYGGEIKKIMLMGKGYSAPDVESFEMLEGRYFTKEEEESLGSVAVLGYTAKDKLFGEDTAVGKIISIRGKPFRVVGVQDKIGSAFFLDMDNVITIPTKTMQKRLQGIDYVQAISARMKDGTKAEDTKNELTELIRENHDITNPDKDDFIVHTTAEAAEILTTVTSGITFLLIALVGISLVVGGVGIMNIMYVSVVERTFEIGLRKALGAQQKDILWQFLTEALLVTAGGGVIGVILGALLALLVYLGATAAGFAWVYSVTLPSIIGSVLFSAIIGLIFGYYPAKQAAKKNPIEALRFE